MGGGRVSDLHPEIRAVLDGSRQWALVEGDCLEVLAALPDRSVQHVITDPPYSEHVHLKGRAGARKGEPLMDSRGRRTPCSIDRPVDFGFEHISANLMEKGAEVFGRVATRWTMVFCDVESSHLWIGELKVAGLEYCRTCAWEKLGSAPQFTGDRPGVAFETIVVCHPKGRKRWNGGGKLGMFHHAICIDRGAKGRADRINETQKPISLMLELVELFTDPGDVILDAFAGGATTGVAALRLGRRFIGVEQRPAMAAAARERLEAEDAGHSLRDARAGQMAMFPGRER